MKLAPGFYGSPRWSWEITDCAMPMTFDTYSNCAHQCVYCFSFYQRGISNARDAYLAHEVKAVNVEKVKRLFQLDPALLQSPAYKQFAWYIRNRHVLQWGGLSDGFDWYEKLFGKSLELFRFFKAIDYPISISTKGVWFLDDPRYVEAITGAASSHWKYSIITADDAASKALEPGTPDPAARFAALKRLKAMGVGATTLRLRPYIIGVTDKTVDDLFAQAADAGAYSVSTEFLCIEKRATAAHLARYQRISEQAGFDVWKYYRRYSYSGSGLLRLNYDIKRPYVAHMEALAARYGLKLFVSDSHHKEASCGAACCGLPSTGPLANYQRGQFAEALQIAKARGIVYWHDIAPLAEGLKEIPFSDANGYNQGDTLTRAKRQYQTMFDFLHDLWNNSQSWSSPARYFGGALVPGGIDAAGDVIYLYNTPFVQDGRQIKSAAELMAATTIGTPPRVSVSGSLPRFPVFVTTKGRAATATTPALLEAAGIPYTLVIDPGEAALYRQSFPTSTLLTVPCDNYGLVHTRQYVRDWARARGAIYYWLLDDDVTAFYEFWLGKRGSQKTTAARALTALETTVMAYKNVAIAALNWRQLAWAEAEARRPFAVNTRAYLVALLRSDTGIDYDPRFEVKSDVALLLAHLSAKWQSILLHQFAFNAADMTSTAGGCQPAYRAGRQDAEARLLQTLYPDLVTVVSKGTKGLDARIRWDAFAHALQLSTPEA